MKKDIFCDNFKELKSLILDTKRRFEYIKLNKSSTNRLICKLINSNHKKMYFEKDFYDNKEYLLTITKFIDYKINNNKQTFRSKNNIIIIENIAYILSKTIHQNNNYSIFKKYKSIQEFLSIKLKENKLFKILLAQKMIYELVIIESELKQISTIIQKYKNRNYLQNYRKNILNNAKFYSIFKYNNNSTKLCYNKNIHKPTLIYSFISELFDANYKQRVILAYLKSMF